MLFVHRNDNKSMMYNYATTQFGKKIQFICACCGDLLAMEVHKVNLIWLKPFTFDSHHFSLCHLRYQSDK